MPLHLVGTVELVRTKSTASCASALQDGPDLTAKQVSIYENSQNVLLLFLEEKD